jgi:hypothetical protein
MNIIPGFLRRKKREKPKSDAMKLNGKTAKKSKKDLERRKQEGGGSQTAAKRPKTTRKRLHAKKLRKMKRDARKKRRIYEHL